ncbi:protein-disulfide reductase DsbD [Humisphaera borealis]|uniref:Thioredoxin family protein n=1 Tax=Humisphaera borealis TaxID=2807512 RepID=A0A7M2WXW6_9BACT|nr:protein-disulfide reductase DsbD [Humisphaera borealis]QOV90062.1 thioredoxin family protein [Humisphaera borealis]
MPTADRSIRRLFSSAAVFLLLAFTALPATAQDKQRYKVAKSAVSATVLKPGVPAMAAVVFDIEPGFHAQSNTPTEDYLIAFTAEFETPKGVTAGKPIFPKGHIKQYPALGKLSVYDGRVIIRVPLEIAADAKPGDAVIKGKLGFQICDDKACFPPDEAAIEIKAAIGAADAKSEPSEADLFKGYLAEPPPAAEPGKDGKKVRVSGVLDTTALQGGKPARLAVVIDIVPGFYAQANPVIGDGIPTTVAIEATKGLKFGEPAYPPGKSKASADGKPLSIYSGRAIVLVPVEVSGDATGDVTVKGTVTVQVCDTAGVCLFPEDFPIEVRTSIADARGAVAPNQPELFEAAAAMIAAPAPPRTSTAVKASSNSSADALSGYSIPAVFGIAFVVGIIFNIVPCVLPVLPLKAIGFYETAQHNRLKSVSFGLVFSLGVIASFAVLGLLVVVLRVFTWGEIFSNPWFSLTLVLILVAMAANMFGVFTVNLPAGAYMFTPRHDTYFGNFLFGILTAALSTPCTFGLFVGVIAVALNQPPVVGLLLVSTVGAGMASPYVVLSALPELARKFPRTGPWAELVKQSMGFMLLAVAVFFAKGWLERVTGAPAVWWMIFAIVAAGGLFVIVRCLQYGKTRVAPIAGTIVALLIVAPSFYAAKLLAVKPYEWQAYSETALAAAQSSNKVVLVEFTASWCSNCHALEALVLNDREIQRTVQDESVAMIKADLSAKDAPGWQLLKEKLKAEGVPLTVIYSPTLTEPIQLAGFYSVGDLKAAIEKASPRRSSLSNSLK